MLPPAALLALLLVTPIPGPGGPTATAVVPDEPGTFVLPEAAILQTVAADVDGDGGREVVRLVRADDEAALVEVWGLDASGWRLRGPPLQLVPPSRIGTRINPVYQSTPVRLLVRRVAGVERVTVASQPHFEEIDVGPPCCLLLDDIVVERGTAVRRSVAAPSDFASAILVIDLDGDGTDELLSTLSLPPAGDISFPIEARVHRWSGDGFAEPIVTQLPVGSGDAPFGLGDSDGVPGDEAAIISTLGPPGIFRIRLAADDGLVTDPAGIEVDQALAVPLGDGRGVAVVGPVVGLMVAEWPPGEPVSAPLARSAMAEPRIVGAVEVDGRPKLVVHQPTSDAVHLLGLPALQPPQGLTITRSPAAAALADLPLPPYSGPVPGGIGGEAAVIHGGRLIPSRDGADRTGTSLMATLAGAVPLGTAGEGELIVLHHGPVGRPAPDPSGGALAVPTLLDGAWTSIAPLALTRAVEADDGRLEPTLRDAVAIDARDGIAVGPGGFVAEVAVPAGSRVVIGDLDPSVVGAPIAVPASGRVDAPFVPPTVTTGSPRYRATMLVLTPAGHAYQAAWDVRVLTDPPPIKLNVSTPFGSSAVEIAGLTARYASVRVDGRPVEISAGGRFLTSVDMPPWPTEVIVEVSDEFRNTARHSLTGIGLFDYRRLPWVPITVAAVAAVGVVLFLRVPRSAPLPRPADDDAALEELESD